ncbi:putative O-antigen transporter [Clostridium puniceum]|uniref:Putative O-antigen transporter n=1 Tax=Clostridium puniceum TaxID=29367 RepID=A0A1S8TVX6_9CLOT|nr:oligosaccharide flippase family protein [Clostridium puniceum]OOM81525.1 putative O-antigen transporter [Clostridium puniceum]
MEQKSVKKNFIYNLILTTVNMIFPLITAPYLSNILGAENIGKVNYATSIINWFVLFASFGIPRYGVREIARNRDDKKKLSMSFWNLIFIQFLLSLLAIIVYLIIIFTMKNFRNDISLYLIMVIMIILSIFSIDWFYQGIEEYGYITVRNIIFKIISVILILTIIRHKENYLFYAAINIFGLSFNNILNYIHAKKYINKKIYEFRTIYYLKELKVYFMTTLIIAIYTSLDQIMVGSHSQKELAYYIRSKTVQAIGLNVTNSVVTVFIPRTAYLIQKNHNEYKKVIKESINYIYILSLPCIIGICFLAKEIMQLLGGWEFLPATPALQIISILILISSIGGWQVNQILIPHRLENLAFKLQSIGAVISCTLNIFLINKYSYIGASWAWVATETILVIASAIFIRKNCIDIKIQYLNKSLVKYCISVIIMGLSIYTIKLLIQNYILIIVASILICPILYFSILILLKDDIIMTMINGIKNKYRKKIS